MGYNNAADILPQDLIMQIQEFLDGECIYIPKRPENYKAWGDNTETHYILKARNYEIYHKYRQGYSVNNLAEEYHLSTQGIYKVISKYK